MPLVIKGGFCAQKDGTLQRKGDLVYSETNYKNRPFRPDKELFRLTNLGYYASEQHGF